MENRSIPEPGLTRTEKEVLRRIAHGKSSKEVAEDLCVSKRTVDYHLCKIYLKLDVCNRIQAMHRAMAMGVVNLSVASGNLTLSKS